MKPFFSSCCDVNRYQIWGLILLILVKFYMCDNVACARFDPIEAINWCLHSLFIFQKKRIFVLSLGVCVWTWNIGFYKISILSYFLCQPTELTQFIRLNEYVFIVHSMAIAHARNLVGNAFSLCPFIAYFSVRTVVSCNRKWTCELYQLLIYVNFFIGNKIVIKYVCLVEYAMVRYCGFSALHRFLGRMVENIFEMSAFMN